MGTTAVDCLECRIPDFQLPVRINGDVIERLGAEGVAGFQAMRRRGLEVGGLLLGRTGPDCVTVEDCQAFTSEHLHGPSYLLSEKDRQELGAAIAQANGGKTGKRIVGLYRSQTRPGLEPDAEDIAIMQEYCPGGLFLMLRPERLRPGTAALFGPGAGMKGKPAEFPLQRGAPQQARHEMATAVPAAPGAAASSTSAGRATLTSARVIAGFAEQAQRVSRAAVPTARPAALPGALPAAGPRRHPRTVWTAAILLCLGLGGCFGYSLARWLVARPVPAGAPIPAAAPRHSIALEANWNGNSLHLQWDRNAPAIRGASSGVLWISDGSQQRRLELGTKELTEGSIQYWPASTDVNFTLDTVSPGGTASESVRALAVPALDSLDPQRRQRPDPLRPAERSGSRDRAQPTACVDIEVPPQSLVGRATGKPAPTVAAKPLRTVMPTVSSELAGRIQDPVTVSVRVDINASGTVRRAELVSKRSEFTRSFDTLALNASRKWTFTPASYGQRRVQSRLILHYHFGNPVALLSENR